MNMQGDPRDVELMRLREELAKTRRERGQALGMEKLLRARMEELSEENFDLYASMATAEAEIRHESALKEKELQAKVAALTSDLTFTTAKLKDMERLRLRSMREAEEAQQALQVDRKRFEAHKKLLATTQRKHETAIQTILMSQQQQLSQPMSSQQPAVIPPTIDAKEHCAAVTTGVQTEFSNEVEAKVLQQGYAVENHEIITVLVNSGARDFFVMLRGANAVKDEGKEAKPGADGTPVAASSAPTAPTELNESVEILEDSEVSMVYGLGGGLSQNIFSQAGVQPIVGPTQSAPLIGAGDPGATQSAATTERAQELYDTVGKMLAGDVSVVALAPVFIKYLASQTDLESSLLCSALRVLYLIINHSERFQQFLLLSAPSSLSSSESRLRDQSRENMDLMRHPRITVAGLQFASLDDYLSARDDKQSISSTNNVSAERASEQQQLRAKLLSALCRVIKNNVMESTVAETGLSVLTCWVACGVSSGATSRPDFRPILQSNLIQDVVLAPKGTVQAKTKAVALLVLLLHAPDIFEELQTSTKRSLFLNRIAKMLDQDDDSIKDLAGTRKLQCEIAKLFLSLALMFPSSGPRFVLESSKGHPSDADGHRSVIFYVARLLDRETFRARIANGKGESPAAVQLKEDEVRVDLIRKAFHLVALLARYVNLERELNGSNHEQAFASVLFFLCNAGIDREGSDSISRTAAALAASMKHQS